MRTFKEFPQSGVNCVVCGSSENKECVLVPIAGTQKGFTCEATPIHLECIELVCDTDAGILIQVIGRQINEENRIES